MFPRCGKVLEDPRISVLDTAPVLDETSIYVLRDPLDEGDPVGHLRSEGIRLYPMKRIPTTLTAIFAAAMMLSFTTGGGPSRSETGLTNVQVECSRSSAFVLVNITSFRRIGAISLEVQDGTGRTLYKEEGKALTSELVRRLDKGGFPRGAHTLLVTSKDFALTRSFTVE